MARHHRAVGRHVEHRAADQLRGAVLEGDEADLGRLAALHPVDILGPKLRLDYQPRVGRHDVGDGSTPMWAFMPTMTFRSCKGLLLLAPTSPNSLRRATTVDCSPTTGLRVLSSGPNHNRSAGLHPKFDIALACLGMNRVCLLQVQPVVDSVRAVFREVEATS